MFPRTNNIEWLRLIFAVQVMVVHSLAYTSEVQYEWSDWLLYFPGVPAFFFTSGFLIYASCLKSKDNKSFFRNRFLRVFPALLFVGLAALILAIWAKGFSHFTDNMSSYFGWLIAQITLGQAYNPPMFRDIGIGVLNGPLWTLTVEILFYISVPIIVFCERFYKHSILVLLIGSFSFYALGPILFTGTLAMGKSYFEFMSLTPLVWGWMFLVGALSFKHYEMIKPFISKFWMAILPIILIILLNEDTAFTNTTGNSLGIIYFIFYSMLILYIAFGVRYIPLSFDVSYGVYIWHALIINYLLIVGIHSALLVYILTFFCAVVSWFVIEKPSLKLKKYTIRTKI